MTKAECKQLERFVGTGPACAVNLAAYLKSKAPKRKPKSLYRKAKEAKQLVKKGARADVRAACVERSRGFCECCGYGLTYGGVFSAGPEHAEMDHFYGRARSESADTCWLLHSSCHKAKTENRPSRQWWDERFSGFCARHGYPPPRKRFCKKLPPASPTVPPNPPGIGASNLAGGFTQDEPRAAHSKENQ